MKPSVKQAIGNASLLMVVAGVSYLTDCRMAGGGVDDCWFKALPVMGLGAGVRGAFSVGYATPNPNITTQQRRRAAQTEQPE